MNKIKAKVISATDEILVGEKITTDLHFLIFSSKIEFQITRRIHLGDGMWRLWSHNSTFVIKEIGQVTGFYTKGNKIARTVTKR